MAQKSKAETYANYMAQGGRIGLQFGGHPHSSDSPGGSGQTNGNQGNQGNQGGDHPDRGWQTYATQPTEATTPVSDYFTQDLEEQLAIDLGEPTAQFTPEERDQQGYGTPTIQDPGDPEWTMKGPIYTKTEDLEEQAEKDLEWALNYGILEKDAEGNISEGPNIRLDTGEIVPKPPIEEPTGGEGDTYIPPVTQADVTPTAEELGFSEADYRALVDAYAAGWSDDMNVQIQDLGPREISPLADQRMKRDYAENIHLMAEPRPLSAQGGRIGYYDGELVEDDDEEETHRASALAALPEYQLFSQRRKAALGGRMNYNQGGIVARQPFFVGKIVKAVTKPIKKIAKSPIGKAALLGLGAYYGPKFLGAGKAGFTQWGKIPWIQSALRKGTHHTDPGWLRKGLNFLGTDLGKAAAITTIASIPLWARPTNWDEMDEAEQDAWAKKYWADVASYNEGKGDIPVGLTAAADFPNPEYAAQGGRIGYNRGRVVNPGGYAGETAPPISDEVEEQLMEAVAKKFPHLNTNEWSLEDMITALQLSGIMSTEGANVLDKASGINMINPESISRSAQAVSRHRDYIAQGGRVAAQEGGLMNLGGMEKDYRQEGGFVPIGGEEKADDVPARLSNNEFVFTADAVRAAGGGDIDAGAEVMENLMENLEAGGKVSEESQGLEGARNMFANAQQLEKRII